MAGVSAQERPSQRRRFFRGEHRETCASCGTRNDPNAKFCISCGRPFAQDDVTPATDLTAVVRGDLQAGDIAEPNATAIQKSPPASTGDEWKHSVPATLGTPENPMVGPRRRWAPIAVSTVAALAVVGCSILALLLYTERGSHAETRAELRSAQVDVTRLTGDNKRIEGELAAAQSLSERRANVLRRARSVLRGVDPLLTSVDELQSLTGDMQEARDVFAMNSSALVDDLILLGNYLIGTSAYDLDYGYVSSLIDEINSEIATVRSDSYSLNGYDDSYGSATQRFDTRASAFVNSVRALERQLKLVAEN